VVAVRWTTGSIRCGTPSRKTRPWKSAAPACTTRNKASHIWWSSFLVLLIAFTGFDDFVILRRRCLETDDFDERPKARDDETEPRIVALRFIFVAAQSQQNQ
jgi:hypothetical protein